MLQRSRLVGMAVAAAWCLATAGQADESGEHVTWRAGIARVKITPEQPIALLGYGDRTGPFESVVADIYAKALALEDAAGRRGVIVTADLVGFQAAVVTDEVCRQITARTGLERQQLLFNASHSHTGPLISLDPHRQANSVAHPPLSEADCAATVAYTQRLRAQLVQLVCDALQNMRPVRLAWGRGEVGFPMNRRLPQDGRVVMADNPAGIVDRQVPVLRVATSDGQLLAVLFGCACHNTTLTGKDNVIAGDYAGFAQEQIEAARPGTQAMFLSGCGADANPSPRGSLELARQHGATLAQEVERVLQGDLLPLGSDLATTFEYAELPLQDLAREAIQERTSWPSAEAVMAGQMLRVLEHGGSLPTRYRAPFAVWQLGAELTLVALPAEPVAEYVSLLHAALGPAPLWVAGFNNDCFGYLPTERVVRERGHEAIGVTLWIWGESIQDQVGFFTADVEPMVLNTVRRLARQAGRKVSDKQLSVHVESSPDSLPLRVQVEKDVRIPLRDGVTLSADVWRPVAAGRFPVLLQVSYYNYDPERPVFTLGGQISTNPEVWGPQDRQSVAKRDDVLVYQTDPLATDTEVTGPVDLVLFAASTACDTDFAATLSDVYPDGRAIHICEGIRGVTFREMLEHPSLIEPGQVYQYMISLWETSHVFSAGHRIRLEVTSSNFPRYARNQNTGLPLGTSAEVRVAQQTIFHDAEHASHLILPVIPPTTSDVVLPRADGSWRLTADTARMRGPTLKLAEDAGILGYWTSAEDTAEWSIHVPAAGRYRVRINFACDTNSAGNQFLLTVGDAGRLQGRVPGTGTWYDQRDLEFGEIELGAGMQRVTLQSVGPLRGALFDLRAVTLCPQ